MIYSTAYGFSRVYGRLRFGRWRGSLRRWPTTPPSARGPFDPATEPRAPVALDMAVDPQEAADIAGYPLRASDLVGLG